MAPVVPGATPAQPPAPGNWESEITALKGQARHLEDALREIRERLEGLTAKNESEQA